MSAPTSTMFASLEALATLATFWMSVSNRILFTIPSSICSRKMAKIRWQLKA
uniref:Uncharacterized protein n=1 Tax=Rhizophora mucronata TaxID=61149 RepID=A0A2P2Q7L3_RHIMU